MLQEVSDQVNNKIMLRKPERLKKGFGEPCEQKHMLIKGKEVMEHEVKEYLKDKLNNVSKWELK